MKFFKSLTLIASLLAAQLTGAASDLADEIVKSTPLAQGVFMLEGAGGNMTALIGKDGVVLVDDDFAEMADRVQAKLKELGGGSPRFIVNTHFHYDHTGGNEVFGKTATIVAATAVRDRLMAEQTLWNKQHPAAPRVAWPALTYDQSLTLHLNEEDILITHYPCGHTDGDSVVFFKQAKVVSLGDLYFSGMYPIFHPEHNGSLEGYVRNLDLILKQIPNDAVIVPGHGPKTNKMELTKYYLMIVDSMEIVRGEIRAGLTLEQIQKAGLPAKWEAFSHGYLTTSNWLALLYRNLKP
jgi:glyoxylase-like metal-dependent hydrolase (beta-lactamase superfamily II)